MKILRYYQRQAIDALYAYWRSGKKGPALISVPTGGGKSLIQAYLLKDVTAYGSRVLCLTHVKELIEQNYHELKGIWPEAPASIYSASLNQKNLAGQIIFAGVQSLDGNVFKLSPAPEVVIIDECHLIPRKESTRYQKVLGELKALYPNLVVIGLTATPYRLDSGWLHKGEGAFFSDIVYEIPIQLLIDEGHLVTLTTTAGKTKIDTSKVAHLGKEFKQGELEKAAMEGNITAQAVSEIVHKGQSRKKWLIFAVGLKHASEILDELGKHGIRSAIVSGDTQNRGQIIENFRLGLLRALVNVNVLTTGFNDPGIDLLACLRPTESAGLWVQMLGRGMRTSPGKADCLVLDFSGNAVRHGPIDDINPDKKPSKGEGVAPAKECPNCSWIIAASLRTCPGCGHEFPPPVSELYGQSADAPLLKKQDIPKEYKVRQASYYLHHVKGNFGQPPIIRVEYEVGDLLTLTDWLNPGAMTDRGAWYYRQYCKNAGLDELPETAQDFIDKWPNTPTKIWAYKPKGEKFYKIVKREWE